MRFSPLVFSDLPIYLVENETFAGHLIIIGSQRAQVLSLPWLRSFPFLLNFELHTTIDSFLLARYLSPFSISTPQVQLNNLRLFSLAKDTYS